MEKVFFWGTGNLARNIVEKCDVLLDFSIIGFIDSDERKQKSDFMGFNVYAPNILEEIECDKIVLLLYEYQTVRDQILKVFPSWSEKVVDYQYIFKEELNHHYNECDDEELKEALDYINNHGASFLPYAFWKEYENTNYEVMWDAIYGGFYIFHNGRKMYFAKHYDTREKVENYYRAIVAEQDERSPHCYLTRDFNINDGDVVVDCGAAEGFFSLDIVEKASKIYVFESDERWIEALEQTFSAWKDKVVIIQKYLTSTSYGMKVRIDDAVDGNVDFMKMDIEGNEWDALQGARNIIERSPSIKCSICAYHRPYDELLIKSLLEQYEMKCSTSKGYVWFSGDLNVDTWFPSWLSRGIIRAEKR